MCVDSTDCGAVNDVNGTAAGLWRAHEQSSLTNQVNWHCAAGIPSLAKHGVV